MDPSSSAEPRKFSRLQQEHAKALRATQETIKKWEQFKYDYEVLQARLHTLPDRLTHDVMVPFGRFGFMQGQLYRTNEVMVLLGDNWFAQRTAKQAIEIAERRKKYVCEMLDKEREQLKDWEARRDFVQELSAAAGVDKDGFEIREEYDPVKEAKRKQATREERERRRRELKVPPPRPAFSKRASSEDSLGAGRKGERKGEREGERRLGGEEMWAKLEQKEKEEEEELVVGCEGGGGDGEGGREVRKSAHIIAFKHSEAVPQLPVFEGVTGVVFSSPADIFRQWQADTRGTTVEGVEEERVEGEEEEGEGEVVRRGVHWDPNLASYSLHGEKQETPDTTSATKSMSQAFSGLVIEKEDPMTHSQQTSTRKASKFKSSRSRQST